MWKQKTKNSINKIWSIKFCIKKGIKIFHSVTDLKLKVVIQEVWDLLCYLVLYFFFSHQVLQFFPHVVLLPHEPGSALPHLTRLPSSMMYQECLLQAGLQLLPLSGTCPGQRCPSMHCPQHIGKYGVRKPPDKFYLLICFVCNKVFS